MRICLATDAWHPQVNGVVRTLAATVAELERRDNEVTVIKPEDFRTLPMPGYPRSGWRSRRASVRAGCCAPSDRTLSISPQKDRSVGVHGNGVSITACRLRPAFTPAFPTTPRFARGSALTASGRSCDGFMHRAVPFWRQPRASPKNCSHGLRQRRALDAGYRSCAVPTRGLPAPRHAGFGQTGAAQRWARRP